MGVKIGTEGLPPIHPQGQLEDTGHRVNHRQQEGVHLLSFHPLTCLYIFFKDFIYLFIDTQREAETQTEGKAGSPWEAQCGTQSRTPGSCPEPEADAQPLSPPGVPIF